jgi:DNA-binding MarR family transcriptional regulator
MPSSAVQASSVIIQLARDLRTVLDQQFAPVGLTSQQAGLLIHVYTGVDSPTRLAGLLGTDTAGITRLVDRLADKGLIVRHHSPGDRRAIAIRLTESGRETVPGLPAVFETAAAHMMEGLPADDVLTDLRAMIDNLAKPTDPPNRP